MERWNDGEAARSIAEAVGVDISSVHKHVAKYADSATERIAAESEKRNKKIIRLRRQGVARKTIAERVGCSIPTVQRILRDAGLTRHRRNEAAKC